MPGPRLTNAYAELPERFAAPIPAQPVKAPRLLMLNGALAEELGLDPGWLASEAGLAMFAGNAFPEGTTPVATVYAGHQFGYFSPRLGDGRALLLGEVIDQSGQRRDIQLKGSGPTPFSRRGDGRSALAPALREYLISEAMAALGIPTTRSLAVVATGEPVFRETIQPGGIVARVAASHIRVGTFQYFASLGDIEAITILVRMVIERHYPHLKTHENPPLAMLQAVIERQAALIAQWMNFGFIHGVMNTDNMTLSGETIDYGPCAFMDAYAPGRAFSSIDEFGRYAYGNQPRIAHWNLARLAETLLPLLHQDPETSRQLATDAIDAFPQLFEAATTAGLRAKLGLALEDDGDLALAQDLLQVMAANSTDFTLAFRRLSEAESSPEGLDSLRQVFATTGGIDSWIERWRMRLSLETASPAERRARMRAASPAIIPRNHAVEAALEAAVMNDDLAPFRRLHALLADPFSDHHGADDLALPPVEPDPGYRTFCGT
jgi:uncharacterized protein YdiU (UPF0061 family)